MLSHYHLSDVHKDSKILTIHGLFIFINFWFAKAKIQNLSSNLIFDKLSFFSEREHFRNDTRFPQQKLIIFQNNLFAFILGESERETWFVIFHSVRTGLHWKLKR